ncbi:hypothetical protein [Polaribacter sargassicola]|uniref:hypothetical protein n=1 Tax=Polaribacter sargassicola TaxID=2836891 RepID=UPI001F2C7C0D|nr:hypothetical protein [Polaribacter sp. DS7-9]MCG1034947.1 hypothetical protein [Polaribacter sp. DS7-9]
MNHIKFLVLFSLILSFNSFSQNTESAYSSYDNSDQIISIDKRDKEIKGTRYINDKFSYGTIKDSNKKILFKFDALLGEIEIKVDETSNIYLKKTLGSSILFSPKKAYKVYKNEGELTYFLVSDECNTNCILIKEIKKLNPAKVPDNGYEKYQPPTYSKVKEHYYVTFDGTNAVKIPTNKKEFYSFFGDKQKEVKNYMKKNKLNRKSKEDLEEIISFYKS